jgi:hypothetical protein
MTVSEHTTPAKRRLRITALVLRVSALGAVAGALAGALALTGWVLVFDRRDLEMLFAGWFVVGIWGAILGAILLPLAGFTLLRVIPLWRILLSTIAGTALGGMLGAQFRGTASILGAVAGFVIAVIYLAIDARRIGRRVRSTSAT